MSVRRAVRKAQVLTVATFMLGGMAAALPVRAAHASPAGPSAGFDLSRSVVSRRLANETDYLNQDGTYTAVISSHASNYLATDGNWKPISNSLVADPALTGALTNPGNSWHVHFGTTRQGVIIDTAQGSIQMTPMGAAPRQWTEAATADSVSYTDTWPSADLKYTVVGDSVKESVLIKSRTAAASYAFAVRTGAASALLSGVGAHSAPALTRTRDGWIVPGGALGSVLRIAAPTVIRADGAAVENARARLVPASNGRMVLSIDPTWLASQPDSAFPINLDPSPSIQPVPDVSGSYKTDGFTCSGCGIQFGNAQDGGNTLWRTVAHFPYESLFGMEILSAGFENGWQSGTQNQYQVRVFWASSYSFNGAAGHPTVLASGTPGATGAVISGSALVGQLRSWADNRVSGGAFGFVGTETPGLYTYQKYNMDLYISYNKPPNTPTAVGFKGASPTTPACTGGTIDGTQGSSWKATLTSPAGSNVRGIFTWWDTASPTITHAVTTGVYPSGQVSPTPPYVGFGANVFSDGHNYAWHVQASDGWKTGPASGNCSFHVTNPVATAPTKPGFGPFSGYLPAQGCGATLRPDQAMTLGATVKSPTSSSQVRGEFTLNYTGTDNATHVWTMNSATFSYQSSGSVATVTVPANLIHPSSTFGWTVAARTLVDNKLSPAASCSGVTSSGQLPAPHLPAALTHADGSSVSVGESALLSFTDTNADGSDAGATEFVYSVNGVLPSPLPACNTIVDIASSVLAGAKCATDGPDGSQNPWNDVSLVVPSTSFPITLWAVDATGTVSPPTTVTYTALDVSGATPVHLWDTASVSIAPPAAGPTSVADTYDPSNTLPLALTANGSSPSWVTDGAPWLDGAPPSPGPALHFDGGQGAADTGADNSAVPLSTSNNQWDVTDNFTVQAWVRPAIASTSSSGWNIAVSQDGSNISGFMLGTHSGAWVFCMPHTQYQPTDGSFDGDCASIALPTDASYVGQWALLTGVWDASGGQIRLYVSTTLSDPSASPVVATAPHTISAQADSTFRVGVGEFAGSNSGYWNGDIQDPTTFDGLQSAADAAITAASGPYLPGS